MKRPISILLNFGKALAVVPLRLFQKKRSTASLLLCFFALFCVIQPQCKYKIEDQLNNANSEPENLKIRLEPCVFLGDPPTCWETPGHINANVAIEVRTGSYNSDTKIFTPDPDPYDEVDDDVEDMSCNIVGGNNTFTVSVPKKGAYFLRITIKSATCSYCCWGPLDIQCGNENPIETSPGSGVFVYKAGKPKWVVEETFIEGVNRPIAINGGNTAEWTPPEDKYNARKCTNCGCTVTR